MSIEGAPRNPVPAQKLLDVREEILATEQTFNAAMKSIVPGSFIYQYLAHLVDQGPEPVPTNDQQKAIVANLAKDKAALSEENKQYIQNRLVLMAKAQAIQKLSDKLCQIMAGPMEQRLGKIISAEFQTTLNHYVSQIQDYTQLFWAFSENVSAPRFFNLLTTSDELNIAFDQRDIKPIQRLASMGLLFKDLLKENKDERFIAPLQAFNQNFKQSLQMLNEAARVENNDFSTLLKKLPSISQMLSKKFSPVLIEKQLAKLGLNCEQDGKHWHVKDPAGNTLFTIKSINRGKRMKLEAPSGVVAVGEFQRRMQLVKLFTEGEDLSIRIPFKDKAQRQQLEQDLETIRLPKAWEITKVSRNLILKRDRYVIKDKDSRVRLLEISVFNGRVKVKPAKGVHLDSVQMQNLNLLMQALRRGQKAEIRARSIDRISELMSQGQYEISKGTSGLLHNVRLRLQRKFDKSKPLHEQNQFSRLSVQISDKDPKAVPSLFQQALKHDLVPVLPRPIGANQAVIITTRSAPLALKQFESALAAGFVPKLSERSATELARLLRSEYARSTLLPQITVGGVDSKAVLENMQHATNHGLVVALQPDALAKLAHAGTQANFAPKVDLRSLPVAQQLRFAATMANMGIAVSVAPNLVAKGHEVTIKTKNPSHVAQLFHDYLNMGFVPKLDVETGLAYAEWSQASTNRNQDPILASAVSIRMNDAILAFNQAKACLAAGLVPLLANQQIEAIQQLMQKNKIPGVEAVEISARHPEIALKMIEASLNLNMDIRLSESSVKALQQMNRAVDVDFASGRDALKVLKCAKILMESNVPLVFNDAMKLKIAELIKPQQLNNLPEAIKHFESAAKQRRGYIVQRKNTEIAHAQSVLPILKLFQENPKLLAALDVQAPRSDFRNTTRG